MGQNQNQWDEENELTREREKYALSREADALEECHRHNLNADERECGHHDAQRVGCLLNQCGRILCEESGQWRCKDEARQTSRCGDTCCKYNSLFEDFQ